jgi:hypothetical protein
MEYVWLVVALSMTAISVHRIFVVRSFELTYLLLTALAFLMYFLRRNSKYRNE